MRKFSTYIVVDGTLRVLVDNIWQLIIYELHYPDKKITQNIFNNKIKSKKYFHTINNLTCVALDV